MGDHWPHVKHMRALNQVYPSARQRPLEAAGNHLRDGTIGLSEYPLYSGRGDHRSPATPINAVDHPNPPTRRRPLEERRVEETGRVYLLIGLRRSNRAKTSAIGRLFPGLRKNMLSAVAFVAIEMRG